MKTLMLNRMLLVGLLVTGWTGVNAQSTLESEVPGDNFSLEGALELFKKSASPEEFEKRLNSPDSKVNNLDLNNDNYIDYIRVIDRTDGNVHAFILQAVLSESESQDVAVIELEKLDNGKAVLQITGDADVYGIETIIEPTEEVRVNAGTTTVHHVVNVWTWPSVQYVYNPYYTVYVSPWYWSYRPMWWSPWRPVAYYVYDPWWKPYRPYYASCHSHRIGYAYDIYRPYRRTSVIVYNHYGRQIDGYRSRSDSRSTGRDHHSNYNSDNRSRSNGRTSGFDRDNNRGTNNNGRQYNSDRLSNSRSHSMTEVNRANDRSNNYMDRSRPVVKSRPDYESKSTDRSTWTNENNGRKFENRSMPSREAQTSSQSTQHRSADFNRSSSRSQNRTSYQNAPTSQRTYQSQGQSHRSSGPSYSGSSGRSDRSSASQSMNRSSSRPSGGSPGRSSAGGGNHQSGGSHNRRGR